MSSSTQPASPSNHTIRPPSPLPNSPLPPSLSISLAQPSDLPAIEALIDEAYKKYIPRIGRPPAPMLASHLPAIEAGHIHLLRFHNPQDPPNPTNPPFQTTSTSQIIGSIHITPSPSPSSTLQINDLSIHPSHQGSGYGRLLMQHAESIALKNNLKALELYTNEAMWENLEVYGRWGFRETGRWTEEGYSRVFLRREVGGGGGEDSGGGGAR